MTSWVIERDVSAISHLRLNWRRGRDCSQAVHARPFGTVGADADVLAATARRTPLFIFSGSNPRFGPKSKL